MILVLFQVLFRSSSLGRFVRYLPICLAIKRNTMLTISSFLVKKNVYEERKHEHACKQAQCKNNTEIQENTILVLLLQNSDPPPPEFFYSI